MSGYLFRKSKVVLSDYPYKRDIENRLFMSNLSIFDVELLKEILDLSLTVSLEYLSNVFQVDLKKIVESLEKFVPTKLIKLQEKTIVIDKEMRKYYRCQITKFSDSYEAGMEFIQGLLNKVPIHILPQWYALPRSTNNIFQAILEKFLYTPKIYERYLNEVLSENKLLKNISDDVFNAPDFAIKGSDLREKHSLSLEQFEECMLLLEYNLVCCLVYQKVEDRWEEVVTPFAEWREYLRFLRDHAPKPILDVKNIQRSHPENFGFLEDLSAFLQLLLKKPIPVKKCPPQLLDKTLFMRLGFVEEDYLKPSATLRIWLQKDHEGKALTMSRHPIVVEKSLQSYARAGWVFVEDFLKGFCGILVGKEKITLKNKGNRWRYSFPEYTNDELELVKTTLCKSLFEAGIVATGTYKGKDCFCVTPFGRRLLED